ncbi:aspartate aminotransferase [Variovorax sp. SG517]|uniref:aminotransferase class I/II-fold pyridoxal phosphate-dependent enzyme n=1 Tax=Variovorax sp. SG517 TaxID=2587117 RepID=UPI00159D661F|nr:aminotransferase class I/II-fold pyridoxal phosphate-dependent enzyme [Variovorax sp. SG517]NVM90558.1 aspartate aminotransferase [Variovorax sp. SG517]
MTQLLAHRLDAIKPSASMAAKQRVDSLRAAGRPVVDFTIGEPDFPTPPHIVQAGIEALLGGQTRYTASAGTPALRQAIAAKFDRENGLAYAPEQIVVGSGAKQIIFEALAATLNPGDEVIVPAPYWVSYPDMVVLHGAEPVVVRCGEEQRFKLGAEALEQAITPRTRWLIFNSPNNPSGAVYSREELEALAGVLARHPQVWLLTDEIYEHFVFGEARHVSILAVAPELQDRTLIVNGMSKAYAMTGWRIGYGAGPLPLVRAIALLLSQSTSCASSVAQAAASTALQGDQTCVNIASEVFQQRRDRMVGLLRQVPGLRCLSPDGAFYVFPSVEGLLGARTPEGKVLASDLDVMMYLLDEAQVATIDGSSYGMPGYLRMSFATSTAQIEAGCAAIARAVDLLQPATASSPKENDHA